jgi:bis(5'-nucleosyl)-tetraphosphatase (symmetrical)
MANIAIGDVQGCYDKFLQLLSEISFNHGKDTLYLVGDVVNRGMYSCEMLKWCYKNSDVVRCVFGNHDIYLLARYCGIIEKNYDDTLDDLLNDKDIDKMIDYVRTWKLLEECYDSYIIHAGLYPKINLNLFQYWHNKICQQLSSSDYINFIDLMYANQPNFWSDELSDIDKMRFIINASTRMRYLNKNDYSIDYKHKVNPKDLNDSNILPWFMLDNIDDINRNIIFGHWSSLGYMRHNNCISIDTGCVWGNQLTAIDLVTKEIIQI